VLLKDRKEAERGFEYVSSRYPMKKVLTDRWRETEIAVEETGADLRRIRELLKEGGFNLYANSTGYGIHIMEPGLSKLKGLEMAASWLGLKLDDLLAIGDSESDMEFLEHCGRSGVPANALPEVKAKSDFTARLPFGEGTVEILRYFKVF
jgi:hypothetical protein